MNGPEPWVRRAGRLDLPGGRIALWSVAEGRRGRRWRSLGLDAEGRPVSDLLLEVDPTGRWVRLELATAAGLLTLHPEPDERAVHGNVVTPGGIRHLAAEWGSGHRLVIEGEPVAAAALAASGPHGPGPGLVVTAALAVEARDDLSLAGGTNDGLPGPSWPLETADPPPGAG